MLGVRAALFMLGGSTLGCSSSQGADQEPPAPPPAALFGAISVDFREAVGGAAAFGLVSGSVYDGPSPLAFGLEAVLEEGECQLREPTHPFCDPACGSTGLCVRDGECMPYPKAQNVGEMQVTGLLEPVTLEPFPPNFYYQSAELAFPPCEEGATIALDAEAFRAEARCVAPLVVDASEPLFVRREEPLILTWQAPGDPELGSVHILLDISHHGGKKGDIVCVVPDTGRYEIPATLVTALVDLGLAGYPSVILTRSSAAVSDPPDVTFSVAASIERPVDTGVQSCLPNAADEPCPAGQTCDPASSICR